jgi:hypothetical protein
MQNLRARVRTRSMRAFEPGAVGIDRLAPARHLARASRAREFRASVVNRGGPPGIVVRAGVGAAILGSL